MRRSRQARIVRWKAYRISDSASASPAPILVVETSEVH